MNSPTKALADNVSSLRSADLIGKLLKDRGKITPSDIKAITSHQAEANLPFGTAAIELGLITREDLLEALSEQFDFPYEISSEDSDVSHLSALSEPFSDESEKYRALRSNLLNQVISKEKKMLAMVPIEDEKGACGIASNLAISFAQSGLKVLLIDCNMRSPYLHQLFGLQITPGLADVLIGRSALGAAIQKVSILDNLNIISAGRVPPNPQELLLKGPFKQMLTVAHQNYDVVIFSTPSAAKYADATIVTMHAGSALLAIKKHEDSVSQSVKVKRNLEHNSAQILGAVLIE